MLRKIGNFLNQGYVVGIIIGGALGSLFFLVPTEDLTFGFFMLFCCVGGGALIGFTHTTAMAHDRSIRRDHDDLIYKMRTVRYELQELTRMSKERLEQGRKNREERNKNMDELEQAGKPPQPERNYV